MKKIIVFLFASMLLISSYGQEQLSHQMKIYTSNEGKLYVNKALPVYLWLSTSPSESSQKVRLISEDSKAYTNPLYFDTEGYNTVRTPSRVDTVKKTAIYPLRDIIFEVYADGLAPKTKLKFEGAKPFYKKTKAIVKGDCKVILQSTDAVSGVEKIYYSLNGAAYQEYKEALPFSAAGDYKIKFYAVDNVGNAEIPQNLEFSIDQKAPKTSLIFEGDNSETVISGRSKIILKTEDDFAGIKFLKYSIDNGREQVYSYKIFAQYLTEGQHSVRYYAEDNVGNVEDIQTTIFYVDKTPPVLIDEMLGDSYIIGGKEFISGKAKMKITAIDNKAGIQNIYYTTNGTDYSTYSEPFYLNTGSGETKIAFYALDKVNNKSESNGSSNIAARNSYMDLTGPIIKHKYIGPSFTNIDTTYISPTTKISLSSWDAEAGAKKITYKINDNAENDYTTPFTLSTPGKNTIQYTGYDNVNNTNTKTVDVYVDNQGPEVFYRLSSPKIGLNEAIELYPNHVCVFLSATDLLTGFDKILYSINGSPYQQYSSYIHDLKRDTKYIIKAKAFDKIGNASEKEVILKTGK